MPLFRITAILSQVVNFFLRSLGTSLFAMAAPALSARLFLTLINIEVVEGIVSGFLTDDKFIVQIAQANSSARGQACLHERRFFFVWRAANGCTGIGRGAQP